VLGLGAFDLSVDCQEALVGLILEFVLFFEV
jgi:hypothetical protein